MTGRLDRYVFKAVIGSYVATLFLVVFLFVVFDMLLRMGKYLEAAAEQDLSIFGLLVTWAHFHLLSLPWIFVTVAPFVTIISSMFAIARFMAQNEVVPMIAKPYSPGNAFPADEVARERITFDKAYIGSCTNGSYDDLLQAALVIRAGQQAGMKKATRDFVVFPGSRGVKEGIENPDPRLDGNSVADVLRSAGAAIRDSWCGPCFGQGPDALQPGQRAITTFNRNWQNRMGLGGEGFLASPAVVAASALLGYMAPPSALGLAWDADRFGV